MEKVEIVIKIPKYYLAHPQDYTCLAECVRRGVLLPKWHGRLGDLGKIYVELNEAQIEGTPEYKGIGIAKQMICDAETIIGAESEEEDADSN